MANKRKEDRREDKKRLGEIKIWDEMPDTEREGWPQ